MMKKRPTHRISYQCDEFVITTCGLRITGSRSLIDKLDWVTIWNHGEATCDVCGDESQTLALPILRAVLQERYPVQSPVPMNTRQVDSIFELLESLGCTEVTLTRAGEARVGGHLTTVYVLSLKWEGTRYEWRDHAMTRLFGRAVTEMSGTVPRDDQPDGVRPAFQAGADQDRG